MALRPEISLPKQKHPEPLRVAFFGTPALAVPTLLALIGRPDLVEVVLVVSQPDRPTGRGLGTHPTPVAACARAHGLSLAQPEKIRAGAFPEELSAVRPDVAVVIAYGRILTTQILETPRFGCVNVHASLLPRWRGAGPIQWSLIAGDTRTGVTTMWMEEGLDTGPMLLQEVEEIQPEDTAATLGPRLAARGAALLIRTLEHLRDGTLVAVDQPEDGVSHSPLLDREDGRVRWDAPAHEVWNRIRGVTPGPGAFTSFRGGELKILAARPVEDAVELPPGTIVPGPEGELRIACGAGCLDLITVQPPGKKAQSVADFTRGYRPRIGALFAEA